MNASIATYVPVVTICTSQLYQNESINRNGRFDPWRFNVEASQLCADSICIARSASGATYVPQSEPRMVMVQAFGRPQVGAGLTRIMMGRDGATFCCYLRHAC